MNDMWKKFISTYNGFRFQEIDKCEGHIYHYTSPEGLKGIFDSGSLFATDMYYLNDESEGMYIISLIKDNIDSLCHGNSEFIKLVEKEINIGILGKWTEQIHNYTISFSCNGDSLAMWNYYTKGNAIQGYNVGFDVRELTDNIKIEILDNEGKLVERDVDNHLVLFQGKVIYDPRRQLEIIKNIFDKFYLVYAENTNDEAMTLMAHYVVQKSMDYGRFFKPPKFSIEEEYRLMYSTCIFANGEAVEKGIPFKELYRIQQGCLIPYQKCIFSKESLKEITFSPTLHNEMAEAGLMRMLYTKGLKKVKVKKSTIPLRF